MKKICWSLLISISMVPAAMGELAAGTGLKASIAADIVGTFGTSETNRLDVREAEAMFYAPVDHLFDAVASMAAHRENGEANFEIHEVYIGSTKTLPRLRWRLGQFFPSIGRLNQFHRHDWPFITAPKVHSDFFNDEAWIDSGVEAGYLLPLPFYLDFSAGVTNGWTFGHVHGDGTKPLVPSHYLRLLTYQDLPWSGGVQTGVTYIGRRTDDNVVRRYLGLDATAKWKEGPTLLFLVQSEIWYRVFSPPSGASEKKLGYYIFPQYGFDPQWMFGVRWDGFTVTGSSVSNFDTAVVPTLTFKASEFSTLRAAFTLQHAFSDGKELSHSRKFELQAVFVLGSHPAHDF